MYSAISSDLSREDDDSSADLEVAYFQAQGENPKVVVTSDW